MKKTVEGETELREFNMWFQSSGGFGTIKHEGDRIRVRVEGASTPMGDSTWPWWAEIDTSYTNEKWEAACEYLEAHKPKRSLWDRILGNHWVPFLEDNVWWGFRTMLIDSSDEYDEDVVPGYASWW